MLNGIDITKAKEYNESVKKYRTMANQLQTEIKFNKEQLAACCAELTQELGMEVNESNLREVLEAQETKINNIMNVGNAVISKIQSEQNAGLQQSIVPPVNTMQTTGQVSVNTSNMFAQQQVQNPVDLNNLQGTNTPFFKM